MRNIGGRSLALGGVIGPAVFVTSWATLSAVRDGYSPLHQPISELARVGTSTQWPMTAGFCVFGAGLLAYAVPAKSKLAAAAGVGSFAVAAAPLGSPQEVGHFVAAAATYGFLSAMPLTAAITTEKGLRRRMSLAAGVLISAALIASATVTDHRGLLQRTGLTLADIWIAANAISLWRGPNVGRKTDS